MKIVIVCYPTFGGSGVVATELGMALSKTQGHDVHFVTYSHPVRLEELSAKLRFHEVDVREYDLFRYQPYELALSSKLVEVVTRYKVDLLHVHYAIPHAYAAYMAKQMLEDLGIQVPIVTTLHGTDITLVGSHQLYRQAVTFSINNSDIVTAVSKSLRKDTIELFDTQKEIHVIPNFIDVQKHKSRKIRCNRSLIESDRDKKIITHISNFRPLKRVLDVIQIFEKIRSKTPSKLLMVGHGPERNRAYNYCRENNLLQDVMFLGKSTEIEKILCFSDLFLLPSKQESFGLAALEAMLHKVPVVSSDAGGISEVNKHNFSGKLYSVGDIDGMADGALEILGSSVIHNKYRNQAYQNALQFDIGNVLARYEEIYFKALNNVIPTRKTHA